MMWDTLACCIYFIFLVLQHIKKNKMDNQFNQKSIVVNKFMSIKILCNGTKHLWLILYHPYFNCLTDFLSFCSECLNHTECSQHCNAYQSFYCSLGSCHCGGMLYNTTVKMIYRHDRYNFEGWYIMLWLPVS